MRRCCRNGCSAWACPIEGSGWPGRAWRSSCTCAEAPGQHQQPPSGSAGRTGRDVQALRRVHHCADLRAGPHRSSAPGLPRTAPGVLELQALCFECHKVKTSMEGNHSLPAAETGRRAPLRGHRRVPLPEERAGQRSLPQSCLLSPRLHRARPGGGACGSHLGDGTPSPLVRRCWTPGWRSGATFAGAWRPRRTWTNAGWSRRCRRWKKPAGGEEHMAKLSINALVGLFARNLDLVYSMRTSNHQVDGEGCSWRQTFTDAAGRMHWDHVFVTELLSNSSYRPVHDFIMGAE